MKHGKKGHSKKGMSGRRTMDHGHRNYSKGRRTGGPFGK